MVFDCIEYPIQNLSEDELRRKMIQEKLQLQRLKEEEEKRMKLQQMQGRGFVGFGLTQGDKNDEKAEEEEEEEHVGEEEGDEEDYRSDDQGFKGSDSPNKAISNQDIRKELADTIEEATRECRDQEQKNIKLQMEIYLLRDLNSNGGDKSGELNMSEVKYANTLAKVHQIRLDLNQAHEKFKSMSQKMRDQLAEKLAKCNEIRATFMELKREVSKKAVFSKRNKGIPEEQIQEWERIENEKTQEVISTSSSCKN